MNLDQPVRANSFHGADALPAQAIFRTPFWRSVLDFYARHYLFIILVHGAAIVFVEVIEHIQSLDHPRVFFLSEISLILLLMMVFTFLTRALLVALDEKSQANRVLQLQHELRTDLMGCRDTTDIAQSLARRVADVIPSAQTGLYVRTSPAGAFVLTQPAQLASPAAALDPSLCQRCLARASAHLAPLAACRQAGLNPASAAGSFCLPLSVGDTPLGLLHLELPPGAALAPGQTHLIENMAPVLSSAILLDQEKQARADERLARAIHTVNMDLARDLHDTLGQNISYLRMKLDQLAEAGASAAHEAGAQLTLMRDVANESYDLIRGTLSMLQTENSADLPRLFSRYAAQITDRSAIAIQVASHGLPRPVSPGPLRQVFYIFREALNNVEKHAHATRVQVDLNWSDTALELVIADDGAGFDPLHAEIPGHYGLKFMRQRAGEINGSLIIQSARGAGARVIVRVPCA